MSIRIVDKDFKNKYTNIIVKKRNNLLKVSDFNEIYNKFLNLKICKSGEDEFQEIFKLLVLVTFYNVYDNNFHVANFNLIRKILELRIKWYLQNENFNFISLESSFLNYKLVEDLLSKLYLDMIKIHTKYNCYKKVIINISNNNICKSNECNDLDMYGSLIFTYTYKNVLKHILILCINFVGSYTSACLVPYFVEIDDEKYQKFSESLKKIKNENSIINTIDENFVDYSEDLF